jgi:phage-related tail fiber protein
VTGGTSGSVPTTSAGSYSDVTINTAGAVTSGTLSLAITPGTMSPVTVDAKGRVTGGTTGSAALAGTYTSVTVNQYGQVTSGSGFTITSGTFISVNVDAQGRVTGGTSGSTPTTSAGSYSALTVNAQGQVTSGTLALSITLGQILIGVFVFLSMNLVVVYLAQKCVPYNTRGFPYKDFVDQYNLPLLLQPLANFDGAQYIIIAAGC